MSKASIYFTVNNLNNSHDVKELKKELDTLDGIISVSVNSNDGRLAVDFDTTGSDKDRIEKKLGDLGYEFITDNFEKHIM